MRANDPHLLDSDTLARRLRELAGDERNIQVDFLLHLDAYDRKNGYLEAGYGSLWDFCLRALHLREGAAGRRIAAMRVLRRLPALEAPLRDGRLCLSTAAMLARVLTLDNFDEIVAKAAYRTKAEVDHVVASLQPRVAPKEGVRKLPERREVATPAVISAATGDLGVEPLPSSANSPEAPATTQPTPAAAIAARPFSVLPPPLLTATPPDKVRRRAELCPVSRHEWSLRVTIGSACKDDLETFAALMSHKMGSSLGAVLHEAIRCGIEKHGKRKGAVEPSRARDHAQTTASAADARSIPVAIRRAVWKRDGGCCTWKGPDGRRCGSRWKVEIDHIVPVALGGKSELSNLRLLCARHNAYCAEQVFGREHMEQFRREPDADIGAEGASEPAVPPLFAREPEGAPWRAEAA